MESFAAHDLLTLVYPAFNHEFAFTISIKILNDN